jgi:hypothetical protein
MGTVDLNLDALKTRMPTSLSLNTREQRFTARYDYRYSGCIIYCTNVSDDVWAVTPPASTLAFIGDNDLVVAATRVLYGGSTYTDITAGLESALTAAGYLP